MRRLTSITSILLGLVLWEPLSASGFTLPVPHAVLHRDRVVQLNAKKEKDENKNKSSFIPKLNFNFFSNKDVIEEEQPVPNNADSGSVGMLKSISNRLFNRNADTKNNDDADKEKSKDTEESEELVIDMRPTFVQFQRPKNIQKLPKSGTRAIPQNIFNTKPQTAPKPPLPSSPSKPPAKPTPFKPSKSKTRRIDDKSKDKGRGKDNDKDPENDKEEEDSNASFFGRVQRFFLSSNSTDPQEQEEKEESKKDRTPRSAASKLVSNMFQSSEDEEWIPVCPKTRLSPGEIVPVTAAGIDLIVVASKDAQSIYCMVNSCPHLGTPLETGFLERRPIEADPTQQNNKGFPQPDKPLQETDVAALLANDGCEDCIVCPLHKTAFALKSGEVRGEWCPYPPVLGKMMGTVKNADSAAVFDVRTKGKNIEVRLNTPLKADDKE